MTLLDYKRRERERDRQERGLEKQITDRPFCSIGGILRVSTPGPAWKKGLHRETGYFMPNAAVHLCPSRGSHYQARHPDRERGTGLLWAGMGKPARIGEWRTWLMDSCRQGDGERRT